MNATQWNNTLRYLQLTGYSLLIASLPLSNFLMSLGMFFLAGVWLLEVITDIINKNGLQQRLYRFTSNRNAVWLLALYLLPLTGLLWTTDFRHAIWDLRMKLPILVMPFLMTTLNPMNSREFRMLLGIFLLSLTFSVTWCLLIYWRVNPMPWDDVREISVFISHIRFSLLLILGLAIVYHEAWFSKSGKTLCVKLTIAFGYFLLIVGSLTGFIVIAALLLWLIITAALRLKSKRYQLMIAMGFLIVTVALSAYSIQRYKKYFNVPALAEVTIEKTTDNGETYDHNLHFPVVENGHYVMTHIAWGELYQGWTERSTLHPDSLDGRGQTVKGTLIRYLASKGLHKDLKGIRALSPEDIFAIEKGHTGAGDQQKSGLNKRIDDVLFEIASYRAGGNPSGHSVLQRFEFWKAATAIIRDHPWMGVGTGDVKTAFAEQYEKMNSPLENNFRLRAHNQYLTLWLTYGISGLILFLLVMVIPFYKNSPGKLFTAFTIIAGLSFFTEDTLESQAGVMFFVFFYLFLSIKRKASPSELRPVK